MPAETPLPPSAMEVFGVLRAADELELEVWRICVLGRLSKRVVTAGLRDLQARGLVVKRQAGRRRSYHIRGRGPR